MKHALCLAGALLLLIVVWLLIRPDVGFDVFEDELIDSAPEEAIVEEVSEEIGEGGAPDTITPDADGQLTLGVGQTGVAGELSLTFNEMVADYRCPEGIDCGEGGAVVANVTTRLPGDGRTFNMPSDEVPQEIGDFRISIVDVEPPLISEAMLDPEAYVVMFIVERR